MDYRFLLLSQQAEKYGHPGNASTAWEPDCSKNGHYLSVYTRRTSKMAKSTRNTGKPWTQKDVAYLKELAAGNTPTGVIGLKLGRTKRFDTVEGKRGGYFAATG